MPVVRVLIVDDQPTFRRAAANVVALLEGFEIVGEVDTGEGAVESVRTLRPDLVLMDVHLPGIDGMEATRRILEDSPEWRPVIFLLSTYDASEYAPLAAACGATAYLPKAQFGPAALRAAWTGTSVRVAPVRVSGQRSAVSGHRERTRSGYVEKFR